MHHLDMAEHAGKDEEGHGASAIGWGGKALGLLGALEKTHEVLGPGAHALGPLGSFLGAFSSGAESIDDFHHGRTTDGFLHGGQALLEGGAGIAETLALAGVGGGVASMGLATPVAAAGASATAGAALGGAAAGIGAGMGLEKATKYADIYHDDQGKPISGAEKVAGWGNSLAQLIDPNEGTTTNGGLQDGLFSGNVSWAGARHTAGFLAGLDASIAGQQIGLGMDVVGGIAAAGKGIKSLFGGNDDKKPAPGPYDHYAD